MWSIEGCASGPLCVVLGLSQKEDGKIMHGSINVSRVYQTEALIMTEVWRQENILKFSLLHVRWQAAFVPGARQALPHSQRLIMLRARGLCWHTCPRHFMDCPLHGRLLGDVLCSWVMHFSVCRQWSWNAEMKTLALSYGPTQGQRQEFKFSNSRLCETPAFIFSPSQLHSLFGKSGPVATAQTLTVKQLHLTPCKWAVRIHRTRLK